VKARTQGMLPAGKKAIAYLHLDDILTFSFNLPIAGKHVDGGYPVRFRATVIKLTRSWLMRVSNHFNPR
jgi:hypothetical protein